MFQIIFNDRSASELAHLPKTLQLQILSEFNFLPEDLDKADPEKFGKLKRENVCTLKVGELEIPSDWRGIIDEPFDSGRAWQQRLARELEEAGYKIDWNTVTRGS